MRSCIVTRPFEGGGGDRAIGRQGDKAIERWGDGEMVGSGDGYSVNTPCNTVKLRG